MMKYKLVAFDVDGAKDIIEHKHNGLLVAPKDIHGLANALCFVLKNKDEAEAMGKRGKELVGDIFDSELMVSSIDFIYKDLLKCGS